MWYLLILNSRTMLDRNRVYEGNLRNNGFSIFRLRVLVCEGMGC